MEADVHSFQRSKLELVGALVQVKWALGHEFAKKQCDRCIYAVRGIAYDMICLELVYDAHDGAHRSDSIYWVNVLAVQYLHVLSEREVKHRVEHFEREFQEGLPRD